ncbi:hypothetical protein CHLRE_06g282000v5 [Chlamydomonas reinhardtii]|uniref:starch synthase n=1 Tax=Chlamydomonas reinhardtii TaxID=3055 RepID=A0A2K3DPQ2_CHLRE|nr:uncharacterized protein CHLRE_06g282000v5 [Chlamydomonas reinhardtii]PNW82516.1 hypothetical protein CHLRE_06g282000v5 [Chlamydomonas reinhardtii]
MASSMGRALQPGMSGAQRSVRKGANRIRGAQGPRTVPLLGLKALRKEDAELLKEAESYMSPEEHAELRRLLEENQRLRQVVTTSASQMSAQQLERFTAEYSNLAAAAEQAGLAVDQQLKQQITAPQAASASRSSAASSTGRFEAAAGGSGYGYGRSSVSVLVAEPPSAPPAAASPPSYGASGSGGGGGGSPKGGATAFEVSSRDYAKDMASLSVELDATIDDEEEEAPPRQVPEASTRTQPYAAAASRFEALLSERRPAGATVNGAQAQMLEAREKKAASSSSSAGGVNGAAVNGAAAADEQAAKEAARAAAVAEVEGHRAVDVVAGREHWMIITVPEKPVAGAPLQMYFNRNQSEKLRNRPHIVMQYGFNHWELQPEAGNSLDLFPAPTPKSDVTDFWTCRMQVPEETYELNFILHDKAGAYENNNGMDFTYPVEAGIDYDTWVDTAAERIVAKELARREAEAKAAEEERKAAEAAMEEQAKEFGERKAAELKNNLGSLQEGGTAALLRNGVPVYKVTPALPVAGGKAVVQYNRRGGSFHAFPIPEGESVKLLYGFNGWQESGKAAMTRVPVPAKPAAGAEDEEWWEVEVDIPNIAVAMNFVFNYYEHYDNNGKADYKAKVGLPAGTTLEAWAAGLGEQYRVMELAKRRAERAEKEERQRRADEKKKLAQDLVKAVERRKVRHVLYTVPEVVEAGEEVTIYYNPRDTPLNGRQQLYLMGGWNRWTHKRSFGPVAMHPPEAGGEHWQATVMVPKDAYKMDFVFADVAGGDGTYDNRGGFDYHLPVEGSPVRESPLYVAHIAVEMAPIAKVGGLGDVVTALGRAVKDQGHIVEVILPRYEFFLHSPVLQGQLKYETEFDWGGTRIYVTTAVVENLRVFFIEPKNGFFATPTVYGRYDDEVRFDFFCKAALEFLLKTGRQPDILHCHDWSTAHVAQSYWSDYHPYGLHKPRVIFTIHNLNYGQKKIGEAAHACQKFTTVSPTYAYEVGGAPIIAPHGHKFMGIRNGIDPELWSPEENIFLPVKYSSEDVVEGKKAARAALRQRLNLTGWNDKFIVAVVSRLTGQKGVPLIKHAAYRAIERGGQFVLLGSAPDPKVQADFNALAQSMGGQDAAFCFKYDEPLSHLIYAAADMIVVPSMFEPCGLTQMIAMRYGTVPIVRHTGGLRDTVFDVDFDKERAAWELYGSSDWQRDGIDATNGFAFTGTDGGALDYAMNRAIDAWYNDRAWFHSLQRRIMEQDWSWNRPAIDYIELYFSALKA